MSGVRHLSNVDSARVSKSGLLMMVALTVGQLLWNLTNCISPSLDGFISSCNLSKSLIFWHNLSMCIL